MNILGDPIALKMPSGLLTVNRDGMITGFNPASERIFGGTLQMNTRLADIVRESNRLRDLLTRCLETGETFTRMEFNVPVAPDSGKRIGINLSPITSASGETEGAICLLSDLTEIVDLQNQIKLKENFAALGEMSAGIAHEFKNSLATILGYAQMSIGETDLESLHKFAREIQKESQNLSVLVTDFLNFARPLSASFQEIDFVDFVAGIVADRKSLRAGSYSLDFQATTEARVRCDLTLMRQTLVNLLINAADSLVDSTGRISVLIEAANRGHVRILVDDTGRGIHPEQLAKIFVPFFTTKTHGTGLGLSLVQKIVLAHNGRIEVQSAEEKGTRFAITLPRSGSSQASDLQP